VYNNRTTNTFYRDNCVVIPAWQRNQLPVVSAISLVNSFTSVLLRSGLVSQHMVSAWKQRLHKWSPLSTEAMHVVGTV